jgi:biotin synthase
MINIDSILNERHNLVPDRDAVIQWLTETDSERLKLLWSAADECRNKYVGDEVHLRGLVEISNYCVRQCAYCGIRAPRHALTRYRMADDEILEAARLTVRFGYGTIVLQSGEDDGLTRQRIAGIIRQIKKTTTLAITLSFGERSPEDLLAWHQAGADRYLLRLETSNLRLFSRIHPSRPGKQIYANRIEILKILRQIGYEVGSGSLIGIPGQSYDDLADDLELYRILDLDMIGVGPFILHPETPLGLTSTIMAAAYKVENQVPNTELMTYKVVALARLLCPQANIPGTTALATLNLDEGRELGLQRGANVIMPNLTPAQYRPLYDIYPDKACLRETADQCQTRLENRISALGRKIGKGPGPSAAMKRRRP